MSHLVIGGKHVSETVKIPFDFGADLASGETISSASTAAAVYSGTDASPSAVISGSASISGSAVTQAVTGGTAGVTYTLTCTAHTSASQILTQLAYLCILPTTV